MTSLDIPEAQVIVHYPADDIPWHHRVLLNQIDAGNWVVATPEMEVQTVNLAQLQIRALARNAVFPPGLNVYAFDAPITPADLAGIRAEGRRLRDVLAAP
eukprot:9064329-Heterocapsa_arctica.AAC.1